jgi:hypothetical protein
MMKTKQSLLQTCLLAAVLLALPAVVQAQDYTYETNNGAITITGYIGTNAVVTIPDTINGLPVTSIGDQAFLYNTSLINVTIPNSITNIGVAAFAQCYGLTIVNIGAANLSYSSLAGVLFDKSQTTLIQYPLGKAGNYIIPNSVTNIGRWACAGANLTSITIPGSIKFIGASSPDDESGPFSGCNVTNVTIGDGVTTIGDYAFDNCSALTTITIPNSVTSIGDWAFWNCGFTTITMPDSVTKVGDGAFAFCYALTNFTIGKGVASIGDYACFYCTSLPSISIPNSVANIGNDAFSGTSLTNVLIGNGVAVIGDFAFAGCGLTSITIPDNVTSIGSEAFADCSLTSVMISASVTNVGVSAFLCGSLTTINVDGNNLSYSSVVGVLFDKSQSTLIEYPPGKAGSYNIPNGVTSIGIGAFSYCGGLTNVTIPNSATNIGDSAFAGCLSLTKVYFKGNAPSAQYSTFVEMGMNWYYDPTTTYYLQGTTGWADFSAATGVPTALWLPQVQTRDASFGVRTNQFGFNINWASGQTVVVEACTNLANPMWQPIQTNILTSDSVYFSDSQWTNYPARFYRLRSP